MAIRTQLSHLNVAKLLTLARSGRRRIGCRGWKLALDTRHSDSNVRNSLQDEHSKDDFCVQSFLLTCAPWHTLAFVSATLQYESFSLVIWTLPEYSEYCSSIRVPTKTLHPASVAIVPQPMRSHPLSAIWPCMRELIYWH